MRLSSFNANDYLPMEGGFPCGCCCVKTGPLVIVIACNPTNATDPENFKFDLNGTAIYEGIIPLNSDAANVHAIFFSSDGDVNPTTPGIMALYPGIIFEEDHSGELSRSVLIEGTNTARWEWTDLGVVTPHPITVEGFIWDKENDMTCQFVYGNTIIDPSIVIEEEFEFPAPV